MRRAGFGGRQSGGPWAAVLAMLAVGVLGAGCYSPDLSGDGQFSCRDGKCPDGFECNASKVCVKPGTPDGRCEVGQPVTLARDIQSSADIVVDRASRNLHVSYMQTVGDGGGQKGVVWLSTRALDNPVDDWTDDQLGRQDQAPELSYTAVDARDGSVVVVFNDSVAESDMVVRRRLKLVELGQPPQVLRFLDGPRGDAEGGDYIAVKITGDGGQVLVVRQVGVGPAIPEDDRVAFPQILLAGREQGIVGADEPVINPERPIFPITGIRNRLAVSPDGLALVYFGLAQPQGVAGLPAQPVLVTKSDVAAPPTFLRLANAILDLGIAFQRVGLAEHEGMHLVWPEEREDSGPAYLGLMYRNPQGNTFEVRPAGEPANGGGPAIAAWNQALGVTYVLGETYQEPEQSAGPLAFTAHQASDPGQWTPQQVFDDTVADSENVLDLRMAASEGNDSVLFHVVYTTMSQQLRYRQIECAQ